MDITLVAMLSESVILTASVCRKCQHLHPEIHFSLLLLLEAGFFKVEAPWHAGFAVMKLHTAARSSHFCHSTRFFAHVLRAQIPLQNH